MNGFLPTSQAAPPLPPDFTPWERAARDLPKLLIAGRLRATVGELAAPDCQRLEEGQLETAMRVLSFLGNAYVWGEKPLVDRLPRQLALPWVAVAERLDRKPMLSYASSTLHNWCLLDPAGPVELGNLAVVQNFLGGQDEDWFVQVHVAIEAASSPAVAAISPLQAAVAAGDIGATGAGLQTVSSALETVLGLMNRMYEKCDPHIYYHRFRPFLFGWFNNPELPQGMIYEGAYGDRPQHFHGQTGAQSSVIPALDALLGIELEHDEMRSYLEAMRGCMPVAHRRFIEATWRGPSLREFSKAHLGELRDPYNRAVRLLNAFRSAHLGLAGKFVHEPGLKYAQGAVGTGGTSFMTYLGSRQQGTAEHLL